MEKITSWQWVILLLGFRVLLELTPLPNVNNLFGLLVTTFICIAIGYKLNYKEALLRPFSVGIFLYWLGYVFDYLDGLVSWQGHWARIADIGDDLLFAIGFFLIGLAFVRVMNVRSELINKLTTENTRSQQLQKSLYQQAYTDELTGLGNRRALFECLEKKLSNRESGTLLYIDVNNFKPVNDRFGHDVGDTVLQRCASQLSYQGAIAFRLGGDEFVVLLKDQNPHQWIIDLSKHGKLLTQEYGVSFSVGIAGFTTHELLTADELLVLADENMYIEKVSRKSSADSR